MLSNTPIPPDRLIGSTDTNCGGAERLQAFEANPPLGHAPGTITYNESQLGFGPSTTFDPVAQYPVIPHVSPFNQNINNESRFIQISLEWICTSPYL